MAKKAHITDPEFWIDKEGNHPDSSIAFTIDDIEKGIWTPANPEVTKEEVLTYLKSLEKVKKRLPLENSSVRVQVALTSTKFIASDDKGIQILTDLNIPLCSVRTHTAFFENKERAEFIAARVVKDGAKEVIINVEERAIIVGDLTKPSFFLLEYIDVEDEYSKEFFRRWVKIKNLLFEYTMIDFNDTQIFTLRGLWDKNRWCFLDIVPYPLYKILKKN